MKKKRESETEKSSKKTLLISSHEVQKEIVSHTPIFLALPRPLTLERLEVSPHCLDNLVKEFKDVFQDPPKGLPPLRGIEHQIDLIPRSSLPNRPATSAKRRKGYALFSAAFVLPAFEKNAVAFLKLF